MYCKESATKFNMSCNTEEYEEKSICKIGNIFNIQRINTVLSFQHTSISLNVCFANQSIHINRERGRETSYVSVRRDKISAVCYMGSVTLVILSFIVQHLNQQKLYKNQQKKIEEAILFNLLLKHFCAIKHYYEIVKC